MSRSLSFVVILYGAGVLMTTGVQVSRAAPAPRLPAFPGAEGFGADTPGGRGGRVIEVTNLNPDGPGSLQEACRAKGPRIVIFRVGGTIRTERSLAVREPFVTIAGQTAPGDGICIRGAALVVNTHDVVVRYLRVRTGDSPAGPNPENRDALGIAGKGDRVYNIVIDHCSFSWATDENVQTWYAPRDVTIQWCITSESLHDSLHPKGPHGKGMILGSQDNTLTIHHCLLAHNEDRNPLLGDTGKNKGPTICDFRNNVVYNHGPWVCSNVRGTTHLNYVGNYVKLGPNGIPSKPRGLRLGRENQKVFVRDNFLTARPDAPIGVPPKLRSAEPIPSPEVTTERAHEAYESVLGFAGAILPVRDVVDLRIVEEVRRGTGRIIDTQADVGGWPEYRGGKPEPDSDHDGMPDAWERLHGFNPARQADGPSDADGDGYTNIEEFLNGTDPREAEADLAIHRPEVREQPGNEPLRGESARRIGEARRVEEKQVRAGFSRADFARKVRRSGRGVDAYLGLKLIRVAGGEFTMEGGVKVTLTRPFELGAFEVTQRQWEGVMGTRPWSGKPYAKDGVVLPASYVNWFDCQEFIARLNGSERSWKYRLPTEAEWAFAGRGGGEGPYGFGKDQGQVVEYAWCADNTWRKGEAYPHPVGRKKPNALGLYDIAGNVHEWTGDFSRWAYWDPKRYGAERTDPTGPRDGTRRILRGGSFYRSRRQLLTYPRSAHRPGYRNFNVGFRLAREAR